MTRQRQILVTVTYNDLGCIIDTKAEPYEEPNLQPTCNQLATSCISRQAAIDAVKKYLTDCHVEDADWHGNGIEYELNNLPSAQLKIIRCKDCKYNASSHKCIHPDSFFLIPKDEDFCSYAERRTDETD